MIPCKWPSGSGPGCCPAEAGAGRQQCFRAPITNRYGLREFGSWSAQSCAHSPEQFHLNTELVVCEILRDDGSPAAAGEVGRVVLTDLWNYARPFIRYFTGDLASAAAGPCACGRGFPLLGRIEGRSLKCFRTAAGSILSPAALGHYLFVYHAHQDAVREYQLIQESPGRARLLIVPSARWNEAVRAHIEREMRELLGSPVPVLAVGEIPPEKSGKRPIIKVLDQQSTGDSSR